MLSGIVLAHETALTMMVTAIKAAGRVCPANSVCVGAWAPAESWLLFIMGLVTITFATKRATFTGLWRKPAEGTTTTKTAETTTTTGAKQ